MARAQRGFVYLWWRLLTPPVLVLLVLVVGFWPNLERGLGRVWPVVAEATVEQLKTAPEGTLVTFRVHKLRDCQFEALSIWWQSAEGVLYRLPWQQSSADSPRQEQSRPKGYNEFTLRVATTKPVGEWTLETRHSCTPFLPDFITRLWPPEGLNGP